jgi:hypothetical protein
MKQNLNEQVSRIKKMMGLNEEDVNLNSYKEESNIIGNIERVGTSENGNPIIAITMNSFLPNKDSKSEGQKIEIKVTAEWEQYGRILKQTYVIKSVNNVSTNVESIDPNNIYKSSFLWFIFMKNNSVEDVVGGIYKPYLELHNNDKDYKEKIYRNMNNDERRLKNVLSGESSQQVEPEIQDTPIIEPEVSNEPPQEKPLKSNSPWTSTSSW